VLSGQASQRRAVGLDRAQLALHVGQHLRARGHERFADELALADHGAGALGQRLLREAQREQEARMQLDLGQLAFEL